VTARSHSRQRRKYKHKAAVARTKRAVARQKPGYRPTTSTKNRRPSGENYQRVLGIIERLYGRT